MPRLNESSAQARLRVIDKQPVSHIHQNECALNLRKIMTENELAMLGANYHASGKTIVQCHGVFDLLHPGHIKHLEHAKSLGDILVVTITADAYVNKGPNRPVFNHKLRSETLAALSCIDHVCVTHSPTAIAAITELRPAIYVKGKEYADIKNDLTGKIRDEELAVTQCGGRIEFTDDVVFSSSELINRFFSNLPAETDAYLADFKLRYTAQDIIKMVTSLKDMNVVVVGDTIIDEYHFCEPYGMASKTNAIAAKFIESETYAGGILAIANHVAGFTRSVTVLTSLGANDPKLDFIKRSLSPKIKLKHISRNDSPTIVKRRYVQKYLMSKLFEISEFNDTPLSQMQENECLKHYRACVGSSDAVIVADFGHGLIGPKMIREICDTAPFLAVNTQMNSINKGYHTITKYPRADYVCIDKEELRMACHDKYGDIQTMIKHIKSTLKAKIATVTLGQQGSVTANGKQNLHTTPIFSNNVIDSTGAGDAYLSLTSLCAARGFPAEVVGFIGNVVGALAVNIVGNKHPVDPAQFFKFVTALLK